MNIQWSKDLETGNAIIDREHKELIAKVNALMDACSKGAGRSKVAESAVFLTEYTKTHFAHEEQLQMQHKYPAYETHKAWHKEFAKKIEALTAKLKTEEPNIASVAAINTQAGILLTHIKSMDVALARFLHEKS